jgi:hypothetical protein
MDQVQKPSNSECFTPSTEPFRILSDAGHLAVKHLEKRRLEDIGRVEKKKETGQGQD